MIRRIKFIAGLFKVHRKEQSPVTVSNEGAVQEVAQMPVKSSIPLAKDIPVCRRQPGRDEPLAFCADCHEWTPMQWLPTPERGKSAEQWFQCEYCGGRDLTLRYLSMAEAVRRNTSNATA